jgi:hypothetical protein
MKHLIHLNKQLRNLSMVAYHLRNKDSNSNNIIQLLIVNTKIVIEVILINSKISKIKSKNMGQPITSNEKINEIYHILL